MSNVTEPQARAADLSQDVGRAVSNAFIVSASLVITWSVALLVKLVLPRHLGPEMFGQYTFAEALALNGFSFIGLGIDTYIQMELPRRPEHGSDFFGGTQLFRLVGSAVLLVVLVLIAYESGQSREVILAVVIFGFANLCGTVAQTCATMLYAARRVGRLSALNIAGKLVWGVGIALGLFLHARLWAFAAASFLSEALRLVVLYRITWRTLGLKIQFKAAETLLALRKSVPFFATQIAIALYAKIDVALMGMLLPGREVGFYGAATNISGVAMLMAPLLFWVLMPQLSRASTRPAEFVALLRRSLEWILAIAVPVAMMLGLGADVIVHTIFGSRFDASVGAMRALAPIFIVVYVAMLGSAALIMKGKSWTVTLVTVMSLIVDGGLNLIVLKPALRAWGEGGAGIGAAVVWVMAETMVALTYVYILRREILDRRNVVSFLKSLGAVAVVFAVHHASRSLGPVRLVLDALVYMVLVVVTRAVRPAEGYALLRTAWEARRSPPIEPT